MNTITTRQNTCYINDIDPIKDNGKEVNIAGWVHEIRNLGGISFLIIRDREGIAQVTIVKKKSDRHIIETISKVTKESVLFINGIIKLEDKVQNGFEIIPNHIEIINLSNTPLPMDIKGKVDAELDTRLDSRYLDLRKEDVQIIFKIRSVILSIIRNYLLENKFIEVSTPKIVASATEGGTELFPISYFGKNAFLNQSPQLFKQMLMSGGLDRIFEIGPIFRAEEHNTRRHLNEATSIDIEVSFSTYYDVMNILECMIKDIYTILLKDYSLLLNKLNLNLKVPNIPFKKYKYYDVIEILNSKNKTYHINWGDDLTTEQEKIFGQYVLETTGEEHYFIIDWPSKTKPFYVMKNEDNALISKSFDLMHIKMELSSGAQRCHIYEDLKNQIMEKNLNVDDFDFYLNAFKYGMPNHSGFGVGLERLIMTILNIENIRETVIFPRDKNRLSP